MRNEDSYRFQGLRNRLLDTLTSKGIRSVKVLKAISKVKRHLFVIPGAEHRAYEDIALQIDENQTISQPFTVATQTSLLDVSPKDKILEIGTGSGYQACVLSEMGANVYSVERIKKLHEKTKLLLKEIGYPMIRLKYGDGFAGWPENGPYDKIIVTAASPIFPEQLGKQLKVGGKMIIPIGPEGKVQELHLYTKTEPYKFELEKASKVRFVPMLNGITERHKM